MARKNWINVGISDLMVDGIDAFLKTDTAKITQIESRQQFVNRLVMEFFVNYKQKTGISLLKPPREPEKVPDLLDFPTKKIKK